MRLATAPTTGDRTVLSVGTLADAGTLDLGGNDLVVTGGTLAAVSALAASGYAGGTWVGTGLDSSAAAGDSRHVTALGVIQNVSGSAALYATFDGVAVASSAVLVKYTDYGDANLDGVVNAGDYTRVDAGFIGKLTGWANGDVDYDGVVDGSDYTLVDNAFDQQALPAAVAEPAVAAVVVAQPAVAAAPVVANPAAVPGARPATVIPPPVVVAAAAAPVADGDDRRSSAGALLDLLR